MKLPFPVAFSRTSGSFPFGRMIDLHEYGWSEKLGQHLRSHSAPHLVPRRVVAEHRDLYRVEAAAGELSARIAGRLRYQAENRGDLPAVGDWVLLEAGEPGGHDTHAAT